MKKALFNCSSPEFLDNYLILFIKQVDLNIYSPKNSSTSRVIPCNSTFCKQSHCPSASAKCGYKVAYLSNNTSSTGIFVEDVLHLIRDDDRSKAVDANITFG